MLTALKSNSIYYFIISFLITSFAAAQSWPVQPADANYPGSSTYKNQSYHETLNIKGRTVELFAPEGFKTSTDQLTIVIYGHGQTIPVASYQQTFEHMARKGIAVIFPQFDTGFFDQDWRRMATDYVDLSNEVIKKYPNVFDKNRVIFSGHSKGAYVALVAAGLPQQKQILQPAAVVLFAPAGFDAEYLKNINQKIPVTLAWSDQDSVIKESSIQEIYNGLPSEKKQMITVKSYINVSPEIIAGHFYVLTKKFTFGGSDGVNPLHYYGSWKWLVGAAWDLEQGGHATNNYIYGAETTSTGLAQQHLIKKSWSFLNRLTLRH